MLPFRRKEGLEDPAQELRKAIKGTYFKLSYGSCVGVRFGRCGMPEEQLAANAAEVIKHGVKILSKQLSKQSKGLGLGHVKRRHGLLLQSIAVQARRLRR